MPELSISDKLREVVSHSAIYGLGSALQSALGIILLPLYTRQFSIEDYGVFSLCVVIGTLLANFFSFGVSSALSRSYFDQNSHDHKTKVVGTSLILSLIGAICQISTAFILCDYISLQLFDSTEYSNNILVILISSSFAFLNNIFYVILRFQKKSKTVVLLNLVGLVSSVFIIYTLVVGFQMGITGAIYGMALNQAILFSVLFYVNRRSISLKICLSEAKRQLSFGFPVIFTGGAYFLITAMDKFVINEYLTRTDVGTYALAFLLGSTIKILFVQPFSQIWAPIRMQYRDDNNAKYFYKSVLTYYYLFGFFITVTVSFFSRDLIFLISWNEEYAKGWQVVPLIMIGFLVLGSMNIIDNGIYFARKVKYHAYVYLVCAVVNLVANIILIPNYGYVFGGSNLLITFVLATGMVALISNKLEKINVDVNRISKIFLASFISVLLLYVLNESLSDSLVYIILIKVITLMCFTGYIFYFVLVPDEINRALAMLFKRNN